MPELDGHRATNILKALAGGDSTLPQQFLKRTIDLDFFLIEEKYLINYQFIQHQHQWYTFTIYFMCHIITFSRVLCNSTQAAEKYLTVLLCMTASQEYLQ